MVTVDDLLQFLTARYDEAEAMALAAGNGAKGEWGPRLHPGMGGHLLDGLGDVVIYDEGSPADEQFDYIAAVDPAHRLADIKLKRAILAQYEEAVATMNEQVAKRLGPGPVAGDVYLCADPGTLAEVGALSVVLRQLGTEFSRHPEYKAGWAP